jgi:sporulation protein YlmC with PRC-barrel domain
MLNSFKIGALAGVAALAAGASYAAVMDAVPTDSWTITNYYKQSVYNPDNTKIGDVDDVLVDKTGKVTALVIGVGGFLGMGTKDVIIPFTDVTMTRKDNGNELTVNETKDTLKAAKGFTYDRTSTSWKPA